MKIVNDIGFLKNEAKEFMSSPEFLVMCVVFIVKSTILYALLKNNYSVIRKNILNYFNLKDILRERNEFFSFSKLWRDTLQYSKDAMRYEVGFTLGFGLMKFIGDSPLQKKKDIRAILTSNGVVIKASNKEAVEYLVERQKDQQKIKKFVEDSGITGVNVVVDKMYFTDSDVALSISGAEFEATTSIDTLRGHKINSRLGMSLSKAVAGLVRISNVVCLDDLIVGTTGSEDQGKDYRKTFARWFKEDRTIPEKLDWDLKIGAGLLCNTEKTLRSVNFVIADPGKCIWANPEDRKLEINNGSIPIHLQAYIDIMLMFPLHSSTILKEIENQEVALSDKDREMLNYAERIGRNQSLNKMAVSSHIHYVPRAHSG